MKGSHNERLLAVLDGGNLNNIIIYADFSFLQSRCLCKGFQFRIVQAGN